MKLKNSFLIKTVICIATTVAIAGIVSNSAIVFGYGSTLGASTGDGLSDGRGSVTNCGDSKPAGVPTLLSAIPLGSNRVQLNWSSAPNPVTYYLVTFGTKPGEQLYGNPNVGGNGTTSYIVNGLSGGQRYYFRVRAGNGCMPGDYSNEVSTSVGGVAFSGVPAGFQAGVLGAETEITPTPTTGQVLGAEPTPVVVELPGTSHVGLFTLVLNFFRHLFGQ